MKYKVTLNGRTYEVEVEAGKAMLLDEYEAIVPSAPAAAPVAAPEAAKEPVKANESGFEDDQFYIMINDIIKGKDNQ